VLVDAPRLVRSFCQESFSAMLHSLPPLSRPPSSRRALFLVQPTGTCPLASLLFVTGPESCGIRSEPSAENPPVFWLDLRAGECSPVPSYGEKLANSGPNPRRATDFSLLGCFQRLSGGGRGIRTPGTLSGTTVFKTAGINHSPIPPQLGGPLSSLPYLHFGQFSFCPIPLAESLPCPRPPKSRSPCRGRARPAAQPFPVFFFPDALGAPGAAPAGFAFGVADISSGLTPTFTVA
jgi:hypothetical protein